MESVLEVREKIYDHIENHSRCQWHINATHDEFVKYCISIDTIQDTAESLMAHFKRGFVIDVSDRYIEYYGILQAVYMQQDAILAIYNLFTGQKLDVSNRVAWGKIRDLRNETAGHPVGRKRFLNRNIISYENVNYYWWPKNTKLPKSADVPVGEYISCYASEATEILEMLYKYLEENCETQHT